MTAEALTRAVADLGLDMYRAGVRDGLLSAAEALAVAGEPVAAAMVRECVEVAAAKVPAGVGHVEGGQ